MKSVSRAHNGLNLFMLHSHETLLPSVTWCDIAEICSKISKSQVVTALKTYDWNVLARIHRSSKHTKVIVKHVSFYRGRSTESYRMLIFRVNIAEDSATQGAESQGCRSAGMGGREMKRGGGDDWTRRRMCCWLSQKREFAVMDQVTNKSTSGAPL